MSPPLWTWAILLLLAGTVGWVVIRALGGPFIDDGERDDRAEMRRQQRRIDALNDMHARGDWPRRPGKGWR